MQTIPVLAALTPPEPTKMPLEARMYGIFAGFLTTVVIAYALGRGHNAGLAPPWLLFTFLVFVIVMGLDGINATIYDIYAFGLPVPYLYVPNLELRFATGLLSGIGMAGILLPVLNGALWRDARNVPVFAGWRDLALLLGANAIFFVLILSQSGLFFYPLSLVGVVGVLVMISTLNLVLVVSLRARPGALRARELTNPIAVALLLTLAELGLLAAARYAVFGTAVIP